MIILASQSERRKQLLEMAQVPFEIVVKGIDEVYPADMPVEDVPLYLAKQKAATVKEYLKHSYHGIHSDKPVLAADTLVIQDGIILGKPESRADAINMLMKLSGSNHTVITGVVILHAKGEIAFSDITQVSFHPIEREKIEWYVDTFQPYDKAGAYGIQEWIGVVAIKSVSGDFYNVMGLPISRVVQELGKLEMRNEERGM